MKKNLSLLIRVLSLALIVCLVFSCRKQNVKQVNIDNQFAISVFSDTIKIGDLINNMDSTVSEYIKVKEDGSIYAYFSDSVKNAVVASDILSGFDDVNFEVEKVEFEIPDLPDLPDLPDFPDYNIDTTFMLEGIKLPFEYEGYEINSVVLKKGTIDMNIACDLDYIKQVSLSTANIELSNGEDLVIDINFENGNQQNISIDLSNCRITPIDGSIEFTLTANLVVSLQEFENIGGVYTFDMDGIIKDIEFETIDGSIQDTRFDFDGTEEITLNFPNLYGDLSIATPEFNINYINTFGFEADGFIDSLYLGESSGDMTSIIKDWNNVEIVLHSTGEHYGVISDLDEQLVDKIDLLKDYSSITFKGNVVLGCDNVSDNMISDDSHIDIIADLALPLEFNIENLSFIDTLDFDLDLGSGMENESDESIHVEDIFDEIEFKFAFENALPLQIKPQAYMLMNNQLIDSLFDGNTIIHANNNGNITEDVLAVLITGERLLNIQNADKILLNIAISSLGENVVINTNDYFHLRIGVKTKTTEIYLDDFNF